MSRHQNYDSSPYTKEDIRGFMLWRPSCPPFCKHVTNMSEIDYNMLNRFLDLKNLCVATKSIRLAHILKKILRILSFGGHLGRHLEYFNFPNDAKVASFSFNVWTYWRTHLCKNILCGLFFGLHQKSSFGNLTMYSKPSERNVVYFPITTSSHATSMTSK